MNPISRYVQFLESIDSAFEKTFGSKANLAALILLFWILPLLLVEIPSPCSYMIAIAMCVFLLTVDLLAMVVDTFGTEEMQVKSKHGPRTGIAELAKRFGVLHITVYVFQYAVALVYHFGMVYAALDKLDPGINFTNPNPTFRLLDFFQYSFVTIFLLGYGDIVPISPIAKILSIFETMCALVFFYIVLTRVFAKD